MSKGDSTEKMERNLPIIAKRVWRMVRVILFMVRKGISKSKLFVDLNVMLKRGNKIATKAIGNLMFHHHHHHDHLRHVSFPAAPHEYEFSCSNTPTYTLPFNFNNKRRSNHHNQSGFFACAFHPPPTEDDDATTMTAVKLALEMLNNHDGGEVAASPVLPGFGKSPMVRQLRITDSPFPIRDADDDNGVVDKKAEEFIERFYRQLSLQRKMSG
ncbi:hypothetical protein K2173_024592 [Erythroxylum novogranatense]|uniref:Avr9/Cf-9 rapidly elicited protein n=1 Tax=Erythroxylum novogranatense TaxID=1862640 RepID=A0AAV8SVU6_9ROSI|nr:hypothetical protein K2173_024592 [Erythroxylum novogranatense]